MLKQKLKTRVLFSRTLTGVVMGVLSIATVLYGGFALYTGTASAAVTNSTVNFSARLQGIGGSIAPDGYYNVQFRLYGATTGGTALWTETYQDVDGSGGTTADDFRIRVQNGYLSANLGSRSAFPGTINWDQDLYITMNIGGTTITATPTWDGEMNPRLRLTGVPYAFRAGQLAQFNQATGFTSTLSLLQPTVGNQAFQIADQGAAGTYTLCVQSSSACGFAAGNGQAFVQGGNSFGAAALLGTSDAQNLQLQAGGQVAATFGNDGSITFRTATDAAGAFKVTSGNGTNTVLSVDTSARRVSIGTAVSAAAKLYITNSNSDGVAVLRQSGSGNFIELQNGSGTPLTTFANDGSLSTQNVSVAAGKSITLIGGATNTRPATPADGTLYYDTTTKQLLVYNGTHPTGKWQADRSSSTVVVGTSAVGGTSGATASKSPDGADFVNASTTSAQTVINSAIAALPSTGGSVYLMEGTYIVDGSINLPNNITLTGTGNGTVLKLKNGSASLVSVLTNAGGVTANTNISISSLRLNGNKANQTNFGQTGISMTAGSGAGASAIPGVDISNVMVENFQQYGMNLSGAHSSVTASKILNSGSYGLSSGADNLLVSGNTISGNTGDGIDLAGDDVRIVNNTISANVGNGLRSYGSSTIISGNTVSENLRSGISIRDTYYPASILIEANYVSNNGGADGWHGIEINLYAYGVRVIDNVISDTVGTGHAIYVASLSPDTYVSGNTFSGAGASTIDIAESATVVNQMNGTQTITNKSRNGFAIGKDVADASLSLQGSLITSALPAPVIDSVFRSGAVGTTTWGYRVTAYDGIGETLGSAEVSIASGAATLNATDHTKIEILPVGGAVEYRVYRTTAGGTPSSTGLIGTIDPGTTPIDYAGYEFNDIGMVATTSLPTVNTTGGASFAGMIQGAGALYLGASGTTDGSIVVRNAANSNTVTLASGVTSASYQLNLPPAIGAAGQCLSITSVSGSIGTLGYDTCGGTTTTLQDAYVASGTTNPQIQLNSTNGGLEIRDASSGVGNIIDVRDHSGVNLYFAVTENGLRVDNIDTANSGHLNIGGASTNTIGVNANITVGQDLGFTALGKATFSSNSAANDVFNITGAYGNIFTVDYDGRIGINLQGSNTPTIAASGLQISGALRLDGGTGFEGNMVDAFTTPVGSTVPTKINIPIYDPGAFGQILAFGVPASAQSTARALSLFDARTSAHQPTLGVFAPNETNLVGFSWEGSNTTAYLKTTDGGINLRSGTTDIIAATATTIDLLQNTMLAAGKSLTLIGGATNTRPATPADGTLYYDTTTKQLLIYNGTHPTGKWQADRSTSTVIVGTSAVGGTSGAVASKSPDSADFVNSSTTSAQTVINSAIAALPSTGGSVYLMEGTYIIDGQINLPSNVKISGAGAGTVLKVKNAHNATFRVFANSDQTNGNNNILIQDLILDGNRTNQTAGSQTGIYFTKTGAGSGSTATTGFVIDRITAKNFNSYGGGSDQANNSRVTNSNFINNYTGFDVGNYGSTKSYSITVANNIFIGNEYSLNTYGSNATRLEDVIITGNDIVGSTHGFWGGIYIGGINKAQVTGNTIRDNTGYGIALDGYPNQNIVISHNNISNNVLGAIYVYQSSGGVISDNTVSGNGGNNADGGIFIDSNPNITDNQIVNNTITDATGSGAAIYIGTNAVRTYLSGNTYSGIGASGITDDSTTTIYANQLDSSGKLINKSTGGLSVQSATNNATAFSVQNAAGTSLLRADTNALAYNIVTNGSFEQSTTGWTASNGSSISSSTAQSLYGSRSLALAVNGSTHGVRYPVSLTAGVEYTLSFYARTDDATSSFAFGLACDGVTETGAACPASQATTTTVSTAGWNRYKANITPSSVSGSPYIYFRATSGTARTFYIDGVVFEANTDEQKAYGEGKLYFDGIIASPVSIQGDTDTVTAFSVRTTTGDITLAVDTRNDRVGIGVASPDAKLHVNAGVGIAAIINSGGTGNILEIEDGGIDVVTVADEGYTIFKNKTDAANAFRIQDQDGIDVLNINTNTLLVTQAETLISSTGVGKKGLVIKVSDNAVTTAALSVRTNNDTHEALNVTANGLVGIGVGYSNIGALLQAKNSTTAAALNLFMLTSGADVDVFKISSTGETRIRTELNSAIAFDVQNSSNVSALTVNTSNLTVAVSSTTVTAGKTLTVTSGATSLTGDNSGTAVATTINTGAAGNIGLVVRGAASQSGDLFQGQDSAANAVVRITKEGWFQSINGVSSTVIGRSGGGIRNLAIEGNADNNGVYSIGSGTGEGGHIFSGGDRNILNLQSGVTQVSATIAGASGQTADILRIQNSSSSNLFSVNATGVAVFQNTIDSTDAFNVKDAAGLTVLTVDTETATDLKEVQIGSNNTIDAVQINLALDVSSQYADQGTCSTSSNPGSLYYNSSSHSIRACADGSWRDVLTTAGMGLLAFGIVPDSGAGSADLQSVTGAQNGPCKVSWASATTVTIVQGCTAYSNGRKVIIPNNTTPSGTLSFTNGNTVHVCLNGTNNQPAFSISGAESANLPAFSTNSPILCLADIKTSGTAITNIYDTRTFNNTVKTFATINATTAAPGMLVTQTGTAGVVQLASAIAQVNVRGVVVAAAGSVAANNTVNLIIATSGTQPVKATGTSAVNSYVQGTATAGYTSTAAVSANAYGNAGIALRTIDTLCNSTTTCQFSQLVDLKPR